MSTEAVAVAEATLASWLIWGMTRLGACWAALMLLLLAQQRSLVFPRPPESMILDPAATGGRLLNLAGGVAIYFPAREGENTLVFFHGNGDQIGGVAAHVGGHLAAEYGLGFVGVEYPGYGVAPGKPSEATCVAAADAVVDHLLTREPDGLGIDPDRLVLFGQSIGCAVALHLAVRGLGAGLILLSPFTSLADMATSIFPLARPAIRAAPFMLRDKFDNWAKAPAVAMPTLVLHGTQDEVVPFAQGKALAARIRGAHFKAYDMGHNNVYSDAVLDAIARFARAAKL